MSVLYCLSFLIVMFIFFHKKEAWEALVSIEEFAEHHLFLCFFTTGIILLFIYRNKLKEQIEYKKERIAKQYRIKAITQKTYRQSEVLNPDNHKYDFLEKEAVRFLKFPNEEILKDEAEILKRKCDLAYALLLGNNFKHKVKIYFKDSDSKRLIETTIWHADEKFISLKSGSILPINRIIKIEY